MTDQLTALDATFLELEQADQATHMHIGGVMVFEPQAQGGAPALARVREDLDRRLADLPRYRQRLSSPTTGGMHWPVWEDVERFDIAGHVRRERLPGAGTDSDLLEWAGEFFSERLDRSRPLWEMVVLSGLERKRWALVSKTHHCMVDGVGSVDAALALLDAEREPPRERNEGPRAAAARRSAGRPLPIPGRSLLGIGARLAAVPARVVKAGVGATAHPGRVRDVARRSAALAEVLVRDELIAAPPTSINIPIGGKRRLGALAASLDDFKLVKDRMGGTVNDVVLAVVAGGVRKLMLARGEEPPTGGVRAMVPVNLRTAGERLALGNRITSLFVHLPVGQDDPEQRYVEQMREAEALKSSTQALGTSTIIDLTGAAPPVIHGFLARSLYATRLFNLTVTNVPGPQFPLYAFGSQMESVWPLVPLAAEHAVGVAIFSYNGSVFFTVNADRDSVPDLDVMVDGIRESIAELVELADL